MSIHYNAEKVFEEVKSAHPDTEISRNMDSETLKKMDDQIKEFSLAKGENMSASELALIFPDDFRRLRQLAAYKIQYRARELLYREII